MIYDESVSNQLNREIVMSAVLYEVMYDEDWPGVNNFLAEAKIVLEELRKRGYVVVPYRELEK